RPRRCRRPALPLRPGSAPGPVGRRVRGGSRGRGGRPSRPRAQVAPPPRGLQSHASRTAGLAWAVQRDVGDAISVFGGICCDREVGGMNPAAVEVALGLGARIVWLPTLSSRQDFENGVAAQLGIPGPGIVVIDADGELLPETKEVLALVRESGAILATGHVSAAEHYAVTKALAKDTPVLLTHATEDLAGPKLTAAQCRELADLGAWVELCAMTCIGSLATKTVGQMVETIKAVG